MTHFLPRRAAWRRLGENKKQGARHAEHERTSDRPTAGAVAQNVMRPCEGEGRRRSVNAEGFTFMNGPLQTRLPSPVAASTIERKHGHEGRTQVGHAQPANGVV